LAGEGEGSLIQVDGDPGEAKSYGTHHAIEVMTCIPDVGDDEDGLLPEVDLAKSETELADMVALEVADLAGGGLRGGNFRVSLNAWRLLEDNERWCGRVDEQVNGGVIDVGIDEGETISDVQRN